jgi:hypothetical protein
MVVNATHDGFNPGKETRLSLVQEAGWPPWNVWEDEENSPPTRIQSPDRPARREWLYFVYIASFNLTNL